MIAKKILKICGIVLTIFLAIIVVFNLACTIKRSIKKQPAVTFLGLGSAVVLSGSMDPTIKVNDVVIIFKTNKYQKGDIVTYLGGGKHSTTHRIIAEKCTTHNVVCGKRTATEDELIRPIDESKPIETCCSLYQRYHTDLSTDTQTQVLDNKANPTDCAISYITMGDWADASVDKFESTNADIVGEVIMVIPKAGKVQEFLSQPLGFLTITLIAGAIIIVPEFFEKRKKNEKEQADGNDNNNNDTDK